MKDLELLAILSVYIGYFLRLGVFVLLVILINKDGTHLTKQYCMATTNFNDYSIKKIFTLISSKK